MSLFRLSAADRLAVQHRRIFPREAVTVHRDATRSFTRRSASGSEVTFHFCPDCGAILWWEAARLPHLIGVGAGAFADPGFPRPEQAVWAEQAHDWLSLPTDMPVHARNPVRAPAPPET